jgi:Restriction endonuclease
MVTDQRSDQSFSPGDRVAVPWGLDVLEGTVVSSHGEGPDRQVVVSVDLPDAERESGSQLATFPAKELEAAAQVASERRPGAWLPAYRYEQELRQVLEHLVASEAGLSILSQGRGEPAAADSGADFILDDGNHRLVIEAKALASGRVTRQTVDQLLAYLSLLRASAGILVTNATLSAEARNKLQKARQKGLNIWVIQWRSPHDNPELDHAIREWLLAA